MSTLRFRRDDAKRGMLVHLHRMFIQEASVLVTLVLAQRETKGPIDYSSYSAELVRLVYAINHIAQNEIEERHFSAENEIEVSVGRRPLQLGTGAGFELVPFHLATELAPFAAGAVAGALQSVGSGIGAVGAGSVFMALLPATIQAANVLYSWADPYGLFSTSEYMAGAAMQAWTNVKGMAWTAWGATRTEVDRSAPQNDKLVAQLFQRFLPSWEVDQVVYIDALLEFLDPFARLNPLRLAGQTVRFDFETAIPINGNRDYTSRTISAGMSQCATLTWMLIYSLYLAIQGAFFAKRLLTERMRLDEVFVVVPSDAPADEPWVLTDNLHYLGTTFAQHTNAVIDGLLRRPATVGLLLYASFGAYAWVQILTSEAGAVPESYAEIFWAFGLLKSHFASLTSTAIARTMTDAITLKWSGRQNPAEYQALIRAEAAKLAPGGQITMQIGSSNKLTRIHRREPPSMRWTQVLLSYMGVVAGNLRRLGRAQTIALAHTGIPDTTANRALLADDRLDATVDPQPASSGIVLLLLLLSTEL